MSYSPGLLKILGIKISAQLVDANRPPEQRLFQAIIVQAFEDVINKSEQKLEVYQKQDAHIWLVERSPFFNKVCWLAGFDPEIITDRYQRLQDNGQVIFSKRQLAWIRYREYYKQYRATRDTGQRREIMQKIKSIDFKG